MTLSRRDIIKSSVGLLAAGALAGPAAALAGRKVENIGIQLYTLRHLLEKDTQGVLNKIADMGYTEVETAGFYGMDAVNFASALKSAGLRAVSSHMQFNDMRDNPAMLIEAAQALDSSYIGLGWIAPDLRDSLDAYRGVADVISTFGEQCKSAGIQFVYHNHDFEFEAIDGVIPHELLMEICPADTVQIELDLFWVAKAGLDAKAIFKKYPNRIPLCHVKDMDKAGNMVSVGKGAIDFESLFAAGQSAGLKHYFVEHDNPVDAIASAKSSIKAVKAMRF